MDFGISPCGQNINGITDMDITIPVSDMTMAEEVASTTKGKRKKKPYVVPKGRALELPPCRVCEGKASGIHYGVNSCEACKVGSVSFRL